MITSAKNFCYLDNPSSSWCVCAEQREGDFMDVYVFKAKQKGKRGRKHFPASESYIGKGQLCAFNKTKKSWVYSAAKILS